MKLKMQLVFHLIFQFNKLITYESLIWRNGEVGKLEHLKRVYKFFWNAGVSIPRKNNLFLDIDIIFLYILLHFLLLAFV